MLFMICSNYLVMPQNMHAADPNARGRAAQSNRPGRFERFDRDRVDDGWEIAEDLPTVRTEVSLETPAKSSRAIRRRISPLIARLIPTGVASMAASTVLRAQRMHIWGCRRVLISRHN